MQKFIVEVTETLVRKVIIEAETRYDAVEAAENLCNDGAIDLDGKDFSSRNCACIGVATGESLGLEAYQDPELARLEAEAKDAIKSFCQNEYHEDADFSDLTKIPILHTAYDEEDSFQYKVDVFVNLPGRSISTYVNDVLVSCNKQKTMADFVDTLQFLDFDAYAEICEEEWAEYNRRQGFVGLPKPSESGWYFDDPKHRQVIRFSSDDEDDFMLTQAHIPYVLIAEAHEKNADAGWFMDHLYDNWDAETMRTTEMAFAKLAAELKQREPDYIPMSCEDEHIWLLGVIAKEDEVP